ncbi:MAG: class I SAM-dependent methyltransferase [Sphingobium sp.]|nr:class I SAM-dependent methyltransferase [Sphingobium sp.]
MSKNWNPEADIATQKQLFEAIHDRYTEATTDRFAEAYKEEFLYRPILDFLGESESLIELASGVGTASGWMREQRPGLEISGCDISESAARDFTARHGRPCYVWDLTKPIEPPNRYDAVLVMGGIHHLVGDLPTAFANIGKLLKPGGRLIMTEPNADFVLEPMRQFWYRVDKQHFDAENEHALSHPRLVRDHAGELKPVGLTYFGGLAYFLLLQNWVLRIPNGSKKWLAPALMASERLYHKLPGRLPFASFIACWQKG